MMFDSSSGIVYQGDKNHTLYVCTIKLVAKDDKSQKLDTILLYLEKKERWGEKWAGRTVKLMNIWRQNYLQQYDVRKERALLKADLKMIIIYYILKSSPSTWVCLPDKNLVHLHSLLQTLQFIWTKIFLQAEKKRTKEKTITTKELLLLAPCVGWLSDHTG